MYFEILVFKNGLNSCGYFRESASYFGCVKESVRMLKWGVMKCFLKAVKRRLMLAIELNI